MKQNPGKPGSQRHLISSMPQINAKTFVAAFLVVTLIFMWVKVFVGGSEDDQQVGSTFMINEAKAGTKSLKLRRVSLPSISGRHDKLTTDMFASRNMEIDNSDESNEGEKKVEIKSQKDAASKLAEKLELDAIILGVSKSGHQAFINGKIQVAGDEINIKLNDQIYKIIVVEIFHNKVVLKWNDYTISVRMAQLGKVN